jgi:hypothetical protein
MSTLSELIGRRITPEAKDRNEPKVETLAAAIQAKSDKPHDKYEAEVFNFLVAKKEALGIKNVMKFMALLVDGAVELMDGTRLTVEIKFRMNWEKACQAEYQFRNFLKRTDRKPFHVDGGLVFFEEFSGDWNRRAGCRLLVNGWSHWYRSHSDVDGLRVDLLRLRAGTLEGFPIADAVMAQIKNLSAEEANRLAVLAGKGG